MCFQGQGLSACRPLNTCSIVFCSILVTIIWAYWFGGFHLLYRQMHLHVLCSSGTSLPNIRSRMTVSLLLCESHSIRMCWDSDAVIDELSLAWDQLTALHSAAYKTQVKDSSSHPCVLCHLPSLLWGQFIAILSFLSAVGHLNDGRQWPSVAVGDVNFVLFHTNPPVDW